jgi:chemotaxis protein CheZ
MADTPVVEVGHGNVLQAVQSIVDAFNSGDTEAVHAALARLGAPATDQLYQRLGSMTRTLHNSLAEFKQSLSRDSLSMSSTNIPDATDKLEAVIQLTMNAANTTLDCTEQTSIHLASVRRKNDQIIELLKSSDWGTPATREKLLALSGEATTEFDAAEVLNSKVLMAQTFQDLTGQSIRKVIQLVQSLEKQLVELVKTFGDHMESTPAGPSASLDDPTGTSTGKLAQDDADSVLKQFGF